MIYPTLRIDTDKGAVSLIREGVEALRPHTPFLAMVWAVFYIPTNLFSYFRLEPYLSRTDLMTGPRGEVVFMMILLNILGYIPLIAVALLVRTGKQEYNGIVLDAFKRIPLYITTSLAMVIRLILPVVLLFVPLLLLMVPMTAAGWNENLLAGVLVVYLLGILLFFMLRYYAAPMVYLMKDVPNFRAVRYSVALFRSHKKRLIPMVGVCFILPLLLNYGALFLVENRLLSILFSLLVSAYMFAANGVFANLFLHVQEGEPGGVDHSAAE